MSSRKHLLVIRLSSMGDVAMTVPALLALSKQYPEVKVTVLTRAFFTPIFSEVPNVTVFAADVKGKHKGIFGLWKLYKELKALKIDAVADLHDVLRSTILRRFFKFGGFSVVQIDKGRPEKKALVSGMKGDFMQLKSTHERYADVFSKLGLPLDLSNDARLSRMPLSEKIMKIVGSQDKKWIGIAPFAAFQGKMYPLHLMEEVVVALNELDNYKLLLFGGGDKELKQLDSWDEHYQNAINVSAKLSFEEELQLISNLDLMLSMDSGNGHLAAMYGTQVITLWGVTHPYAGFAPFGQEAENSLLADREKFPLIPSSIYGNKMPEGYEKAMETIHPMEIVKKIMAMLV